MFQTFKLFATTVHYWYLILFLFTAFHLLSFLHFPLLHFQRPQAANDVLFVDLLRRCLDVNPDERITANDAFRTTCLLYTSDAADE